MPWGDGTGPDGLGPRTGWGLGYCSGYPYPGYANPINRGGGRFFGAGRFRWRGRGAGWGFHRGRGFGRWGWRAFPYTPYYPLNYPVYEDNINDKTYWENRLKDAEEELNYIKQKLDELTSENDSQ